MAPWHDLIAYVLIAYVQNHGTVKGHHADTYKELKQEREERDGLILLCLFFMELNRCGELHEKQT